MSQNMQTKVVGVFNNEGSNSSTLQGFFSSYKELQNCTYFSGIQNFLQLLYLLPLL